MATSSSTCKLIYSERKLRISKECETIDYSYLECNGYCPSNTLFYLEEEINSVSCCSLQNLQTKDVRIYCSRKLNSTTDFENDYSQYRKDTEIMEEFQNSFTNPVWNYIKPVRNYTGFYTILMATNATCECSKINL